LIYGINGRRCGFKDSERKSETISSMTGIMTKLIFGDCREHLKTIPNDSIDLIITSPPYADSRAHTYGGIKPDDYDDTINVS